MIKPTRVALLTTAMALLTSFPVMAVKPAQWSQQSEADFDKHDKKDVVVTTGGEVILARKSKELARLEKEDTIIYDLAQSPDGKVYVATGAKGKLMRYAGEKLEEVAKFEGEQLFTMLATKEGLWLGLSGAEARLVLMKWDGTMNPELKLPGVQFIWDIKVLSKDQLVLGTGAPGKVITVGTGINKGIETIFEAKQSNILTLGVGEKGVVFAGTDEGGLVYKIMPGRPKVEMVNKREEGAGQQRVVPTYDVFVLYDAPESEIGTLIVNADGTLYVGTSDARAARPGRLKPPAKNETGKTTTQPDGDSEEKNPEPVEPIDEKKPATQPESANVDEVNVESALAEAQGQEQLADWGYLKVKLNSDEGTHVMYVPRNQDSQTLTRQILSRVVTKLNTEGKRPTPEQYEKLRQVIKERLDKAREEGELSIKQPDAQATTNQNNNSSGNASKSSSSRSSSTRGKKKGNAIYHIDELGFAREVFRETVMILDILPWKDQLLVATGNEGQLYMVNPKTMDAAVLLKTDSKQILKLLDAGIGAAYMGLSNEGVLMKLEPGYAKEGVLTSEVLDAEYLSLWGAMQVDAMTSIGDKMKIETRSGNVSDPEEGGWSKWSEAKSGEMPKGDAPYRLVVSSPPARYFQYRVTFTSGKTVSPKLMGWRMKYMTMNMRPEIEAFGVKMAPDKSGAMVLNLAWKASDPNKDTLIYALYAKNLSSEAGYIRVADKISDTKMKLEDPGLPAGRYVLKLKASDQPDNVPGQALEAQRLSTTVVIDPDAPTFKDVKFNVVKGKVAVSGNVVDEISDIQEIRYQLNSKDEMVYVLPNDLIYDSTKESFSITISDLSPGTHLLVIQVKDEMGNVSRHSKTVVIPK